MREDKDLSAGDKPVELVVFGDKIKVSAERIEYNRLRKLFADLAAKQRAKIDAELGKKAQDIDDFRKGGNIWARGFINAAADLAVDQMMAKGCYDFDKETFIKRYLDVSPWENRFKKFCSEIDAVDAEEADREQARKERSFEAKHRWSGVGDDAIQEAERRNFNEGISQGIANTAGRLFYAVANSMSKDKIFSKYRNSLVDGIQITVRTAVDELVDCLADNGHPLPGAKVDKESREKAERLFNNLKSGKLPQEAVHGARMQILALNPYLFDFYEHVYLTEGDKVAEFFGFSLEELKEKAFRKQLGPCEFKTAAETEEYRAKAIRIGKELGFDPKDVLEDCDARLKRFEELTRTTLNVLYPTCEDAQAAYGDRQAFYKGIAATVKAAEQEKFYLNEGIPPKRLANARAAFPIHAQETVIAFMDTTLFGSGKTGLAVTRWGLRWVNMAEKPPAKSLSWEAFAKLPECPKRQKSKMVFSPDATYDNTNSGVDDEKVFGVIRELYDYCRAATFFTDISPEEPPEEPMTPPKPESQEEPAKKNGTEKEGKREDEAGTSPPPPDQASSGSLFQRCKATYVNEMKNWKDFKGRMSTQNYRRFLAAHWTVGIGLLIISFPLGGALGIIYIFVSIPPVVSATVRWFNDYRIRKDGFK